MMKYKIVLLGSGGVGKTAITIRLIKNTFIQTYDPTIEDTYFKHLSLNNENYILDIIDTAGQEEYSGMMNQYVKVGQGFILVYCITSREAFVGIEKYYNLIYNIKESDKVPIILVGNKNDLQDRRMVSYKEGTELAKIWNVPFYEISAKCDPDITNIFNSIIIEMNKCYQKQNIKKKKNKKCIVL